MITLDEFKKRIADAWNSENDVRERLLVIESTIEDILEEM